MKRLLLLLVFACHSLLAAKQVPAMELVVVKSNDHVVYEQALEGFRTVFSSSFKTLTMDGSSSDSDAFEKQIRKLKPKVILALGLRASKMLKERFRHVPIVFCMAIRPHENDLKTTNTTGVHTEPRVEHQIKAFKDAIPDLKILALPHNPERFSDFVEKAKKAASKVGVELLAIPVKDRKLSPAAILKAREEADALWFIRDPTVLMRENFNYSLIMQFERKIPVVAYGAHFVRKGAFCSCAASYSEQGRIAAILVKRILEGEKPSGIPIQHPEGILTINTDSAMKAGVKVPRHVLMRPGTVTIGYFSRGSQPPNFPDSPASLDFEK